MKEKKCEKKGKKENEIIINYCNELKTIFLIQNNTAIFIKKKELKSLIQHLQNYHKRYLFD